MRFDAYHVRDQTGTSHLPDGVLGWLGLLLFVDDRDV
jgi:hypothetical protein